MEHILKARNLTKVYGFGEAKVEAVKGINLDVEKGYFYTIIGKCFLQAFFSKKCLQKTEIHGIITVKESGGI